jgi:hypothetical protein
MKNQFTLTNVVARSGRVGLALAGLMLLALAASASPAKVLPPSSLPYGLSYEEWSAKWWQWYLGQSTNHLELVGSTGVCDGPGKSVRFLYGAPSTTTAIRHITISSETPLFFAVLGFVADNTACPVTDFSSNSAIQLEAEVVGGWSGATLTTCTIDGDPVAGMEDPTNSIYNIVSPPFTYITAEKDNILSLVEGEDCIPGGMSIYPAVTDGVYVMLSPFKPGRHTLHFVGVVGSLSSPDLKLDITYDIEVVPE